MMGRGRGEEARLDADKRGTMDCERIDAPVRNDEAVAGLVADLVGLATGVQPAEIVARGRSRPRAVEARRTCMYLTYVVLQWPLARVGTAFGRDRSSASVACREVEERRDDPAFDAQLERLEACLRLAPVRPSSEAVH